MLKVIGYLNGTSKENTEKLIKMCSDAGYEVAYTSEFSVTILEEVDSLDNE